MASIDHLVVAARTLAQGSDYVERVLGVRPGPGGKHPLMGTHNRLLGLGHRTYLEVIAIDPQAPAPGRPRWFNLDHLELSEPRLLSWVACSSDIASALPEMGDITRASRGNLEWLIAIPPDGRLHQGGLVPYLIQWGESHPTDNLGDSGCRLIQLLGFHPEPKRVMAMLERLDIHGITIQEAPTASLEAHIQTSTGLKVLR